MLKFQEISIHFDYALAMWWNTYYIHVHIKYIFFNWNGIFVNKYCKEIHVTNYCINLENTWIEWQSNARFVIGMGGSVRKSWLWQQRRGMEWWILKNGEYGRHYDFCKNAAVYSVFATSYTVIMVGYYFRSVSFWLLDVKMKWYRFFWDCSIHLHVICLVTNFIFAQSSGQSNHCESTLTHFSHNTVVSFKSFFLFKVILKTMYCSPLIFHHSSVSSIFLSDNFRFTKTVITFQFLSNNH